ncbi:UbiD family decarboxylase [Candidatus Schneideria nysicola]|uniref:UbiD family decarboxylase n=1 Tax=Candidatus Schneideria nysicola TaxID=1081631 RepID=UPI001CAA5CF4|nr:UbiD family decarboxylase [Candidatus Schneideria nysicola]UAJ65047.1 UbiD family decarboxylase [Candidatus Schneideria nysicola]
MNTFHKNDQYLTSKSEEKEWDLQNSIELLNHIKNEIIYTNDSVNPILELSSIYRYIGAYGTIMRPTKSGPAILFNNIKDYPHIKILIGLLCSRQRIAHLFHTKKEQLAFLLKEALDNPIPPQITTEKGLCQEIIYKSTDKNFDILKILPIPIITEEDAGHYITLGMCYTSNIEKNQYDISIHRLCVQSKDELSIYSVPGRHLDIFYQEAESYGKSLPISINIGVDPAITISTCFEPPTTPLGFDELSIAGSLRKKPIKLVKCLFVDALAISHSEIVIEGELLPNIRIAEDNNTNTGKSMPEFTGYTGYAKKALPIIKVKAITTKHNPIFQTCIGSSDEHTNIAGIPTEASILKITQNALPELVINVHCPTSGGGKYLAILQIRKRSINDEGKQRQAALLAFSIFSEIKHVILVDEDVDIFDMNDVIWSLTTRYQGDKSTIFIPGVRCHPLDPSSDPNFSSSIQHHGITCKTIFDSTVPFTLKNKFKRSQFKEIDISSFNFFSKN